VVWPRRRGGAERLATPTARRHAPIGLPIGVAVGPRVQIEARKSCPVGHFRSRALHEDPGSSRAGE
jgi:hypothetical protein